MKKINYHSLNLDDFEKLNVESRSKIYKDDKNNIYKIFNINEPKILKVKEKKIEILSKIDDSFLTTPKSKIMDGGLFKGYTYNCAEGLDLYELKNKKDELTFLKALINSSKKLSEIHNLKENIVVGDMHFHNIIMDNNLNPHFIDVDSYGVGKYESDDFPVELYIYCSQLGYEMLKTKDYDRLSFIIGMFKIIFGSNILKVSPMDYRFASRKYEFLQDENLEELYYCLKSKSTLPTEVPYLHELIKE